MNDLLTIWIVGAASLPTAAAVTVAFALLAYLLGGVSVSGAITGSFLCFILYASAGLGAFAALMTVFLLAWTTTKIGYARKQELGIAEKRGGRSSSQIFSNLSVAAVFALIYAVIEHRGPFLLAAGAALAEAAGDTVSSEFGQCQSHSARLLTTWEPVPAGTDGGISLNGTMAGIFAVVAVGAVYAGSGEISWRSLWILVFAATVGFMTDSLLGATFERRELLNNNSVNFLSTLVAALAALAIASI
ncbi:MAG: DUF92 domain-containing protein [Acidobacteriota bacterium]|nr:DUF92 domain-containing protein [Acidobacteriota bacterium]